MRRDTDQYAIVGDLTLHGVTREIVLDATLEGRNKDPWGNSRVGFTATEGSTGRTSA